jgi:hypothetical protein
MFSYEIWDTDSGNVIWHGYDADDAFRCLASHGTDVHTDSLRLSVFDGSGNSVTVMFDPNKVRGELEPSL